MDNIFKNQCIITILGSMLILFSGCVTDIGPRYVTVHEGETIKYYIPPNELKINKSRVFYANYDKAWEAIVYFFAENNIPIKTIEKNSGIIMAEKTLDSSNSIREFVNVGYIERERITYEIKKKVIYPYQSSILSKREYSRMITGREPADVRVLSSYNIFAKRLKGGISISVNVIYKISPPVVLTTYSLENNSIDADKAKAVSTGLFEKMLLDYIEYYLEENGKQ